MNYTNTIKSTLLATCAMLGGEAAFAQSGPAMTIYGVMDAAVEVNRSGKGSVTRLVSGGSLGSRLGFRGVEDLGGGLSAVFRLEQGLTIDDGQLGQGGRTFGRESTVGLSSTDWGTALLGRMPTPHYAVLNGVDAFSWMGSGGLLSISRSGTASRQLQPLAITARYDNAIGYVSPRLSDVELRALVSTTEGSPVVGRGYGASARYTVGPVDALVGVSRLNGPNNTNGRVDALVLGGSYNIGPARVFAGYTTEKNTCLACTSALARVEGVSGGGTSEFRLFNLGLRVPIGALTGIAQVVRIRDASRYSRDPGNRNATWLAVGAEYAVSRRTAAYASFGTIGNGNGSQYALGSGTTQQPAGTVAAGNPRSTTAVVGMRHTF